MEIILSPDVVLIRDFFVVRAKLTYFRLDHGGGGGGESGIIIFDKVA